MLLLTFSRFRSFLGHCMTKVQGSKSSPWNTTTHSPTLLLCAWKGFRRTVALLSPSPHPESPHLLAPTAYHLFGLVQDQMGSQYYAKKEAVQVAIRPCLRTAETEFDLKGIFKLPERQHKCIDLAGDFVDKRIQCTQI